MYKISLKNYCATKVRKCSTRRSKGTKLKPAKSDDLSNKIKMGKKRTISHVEEFQINYINTLRERERLTTRNVHCAQ